MSCAALGSIFSKLCDSVSCVFGTFCNCSQNHVVVIGNATSPAAVELMKISQTQPDLMKALALFKNSVQQEEPSIEIKPGPLPKKKEERHIVTRAAVLQIANSSVQAIKHEKMSQEECLLRLTSAAALAGIKNIHSVYAKFKPVSPAAMEMMEHRVSQIQQYGSAAAFLWKQLKQVDLEDQDSLAYLVAKNLILVEQVPVLQKILKKKKGLASLTQDSFGQISKSVQDLFLAAARRFSPKFIDTLGFVSWGEGEKEISSEEISSHEDRGESSQAPELIGLFKELGLEAEKNGILEGDFPVGAKRAALLSFVCGFSDTPLMELSSQQIRILKERKGEVQKLSGAMVHLFFALKNTLDPVTLINRHFFSQDINKEIKKSIKSNHMFLEDIKKSDFLCELNPGSLLILYNASKLFEFKMISFFLKQYPVDFWKKSSQSFVATHLMETKESISPSYSGQKEQAIAEKIMDEEREKVFMKKDSKASPERRGVS